MKNFIKDMLSETGSVSSMRVMAFLCLITAIILVFLNKSGYETFLLAAMGGKVAQSITENKS